MDIISSAVRNLAILNGGGRLTDKCVALITKKRGGGGLDLHISGKHSLVPLWKTDWEYRLWKLKTASP
jgi:hypothetical protein